MLCDVIVSSVLSDWFECVKDVCKDWYKEYSAHLIWQSCVVSADISQVTATHLPSSQIYVISFLWLHSTSPGERMRIHVLIIFSSFCLLNILMRGVKYIPTQMNYMYPCCISIIEDTNRWFNLFRMVANGNADAFVSNAWINEFTFNYLVQASSKQNFKAQNDWIEAFPTCIFYVETVNHWYSARSLESYVLFICNLLEKM